jgi:hypothetical protein
LGASAICSAAAVREIVVKPLRVFGEAHDTVAHHPLADVDFLADDGNDGNVLASPILPWLQNVVCADFPEDTP